MIRVFKTGRHGHRTPLSYPALAPLWAEDITLVDRPDAADLYVFGHCLDVEQAPQDLVEDWRRRRVPVIWLSEEPFWDTIWGQRPLDRQIYPDSPFGPLPLRQISHQTSPVFAFDRLPYYLLTNPRFARAYGQMFARNAQLRPSDWQHAFATRASAVSFMFERRIEPYHNVSWPEADVTGLCAWRSHLAEACVPDPKPANTQDQPGRRVDRFGQSWQGGISRFDLKTDWHQDKLQTLDGRAQQIGALENTHQPAYLTEKLFDAFACGARPLYWASPQNRIHDYDLPEESWANLYGMDPQEAAEAVMGWTPDQTFFEAYAEAQTRLAALLCDPAIWQAEAQRFIQALIAALHAELAVADPA